MKLLHVLLQPKPCSESRECKQMHAHANTHTTPSPHTRTHKHTCSLSLVSVGDQLFCRLHSAAVAAARAPRLRSRSYSAAAERQKQVQKGAFRAAARWLRDTNSSGCFFEDTQTANQEEPGVRCRGRNTAPSEAVHGQALPADPRRLLGSRAQGRRGGGEGHRDSPQAGVMGTLTGQGQFSNQGTVAAARDTQKTNSRREASGGRELEDEGNDRV